MLWRKKPRRTYTKKVTKNVLVFGCLAGCAPFILSAMGKEPLQELGIAWITGVVCVALGYFVRGYKDTKSMKDDEYRKKLTEREVK